MNRGTFCISIDTELLWGRQDLNYKPFIPRVKKERAIIKRLLGLFSKYNTPATWAIVGKIFEDPPKGKKNPELWYGKDIVQLIKSHKNHEIACHSYSHPEFSTIIQKEADTEIRKCVELAEREGVNLRSFIFPRNKVDHLNILKKYGFASYRGSDPNFSLFKNPYQKIFEFIDLMLLLPHSTLPRKANGLVNIPGTMYFVSSRGLKKYIPLGIRSMKAKRGINQAIEKGEMFHLWFHPVDFADDTKKVFRDFETILKYVAEKRDKRLLEIKTMREVALEYRF